MRILFHPDAAQELADSEAWYDLRRPGLGRELELDVYAALELIRENPNAWAKWPGLEQVRVFPMDRFPFMIPYSVLGEKLVVLAVAHAKRTPGYWSDRVGDL